ncbi:hypothetical protein FACS1894169_14390 [Bacteroidia bacterium]|nr:hypothetical protein FACS1894169_14390 [Bacteroidia bacterium]
MERKIIKVTGDIEVTVLPDSRHEYLMTTKEVANGYGVSPETIRSHRMLHSEELIEGKHFVRAVEFFNSGCKSGSYNTPPDNRIFWTKRGIVRLGFFIKSERAKLFRDWAEDLIITIDEHRDLFGEVFPGKVLGRRNHNRLTQDRLIDILKDVAMIEDKGLRISIIRKLTGE